MFLERKKYTVLIPITKNTMYIFLNDNNKLISEQIYFIKKNHRFK